MGAIKCNEFSKQEEFLGSLGSGKCNYLLRNNIILLIEVFDKVFHYYNYLSLSILLIT
jgi:hypothetical protein